MLRSRSLLRTVPLLVHLAFCTTSLAAQSAAPKDDTLTLRVTPREVLVDVIAVDSKGKPVSGLKPSDFTILEEGKPQRVSGFAEESPVRARAKYDTVPPLPEHTFTNHPAYTKGDASTSIILLDVLNTREDNRPLLRQTLFRFIDKYMDGKQRVAIYALGDHLILLRGLTTDPKVARAAAESYLQSARNPDSVTNADQMIDASAIPLGDFLGALGQMKSALSAFDDALRIQQLDNAAQTTFGAFKSIAQSAKRIPGRKA